MERAINAYLRDCAIDAPLPVSSDSGIVLDGGQRFVVRKNIRLHWKQAMCNGLSERSFEMKKTRHTEEQIIGALKQMEAGRKVSEMARELGVSEATGTRSLYSQQRWRTRAFSDAL